MTTRLVYCIEASHSRGMGHLFRALNLIPALKSQLSSIFVVTNPDTVSEEILRSNGIKPIIANTYGIDTDWEESIIESIKPDIWINDRLFTTESHVQKVRSHGISVITFDDEGPGALVSNLIFWTHLDPPNFASSIRGHLCHGFHYLVLNQDINLLRRIRSSFSSLIISLGGSDTYGVAEKIFPYLDELDIKITICLGPNYRHSIPEKWPKHVQVKRSVPSLVHELSDHDIAITSGGITALEAASLGLATFAIANELHEIPLCKSLDKLGCVHDLGYYKDIDFASLLPLIFSMPKSSLSKRGYQLINPQCINNIVTKIFSLTS